MALDDKILIGERVRKIRENIFEESRSVFAKRCNLTERHIGQIERGDFLPSIIAFDKICSATGLSMDYLLYGKGEKNFQLRETLHNIIDTSNKEDLKVYYKFICTLQAYSNNKNKKP